VVLVNDGLSGEPTLSDFTPPLPCTLYPFHGHGTPPFMPMDPPPSCPWTPPLHPYGTPLSLFTLNS